MSRQTFQQHGARLKATVESALASLLDATDWPPGLKTAVEYSLMAGGKRLRPMLVLLAAELCGGKPGDAMPAACSIEMVHTYSLIHDDLPSMDNDDFRRGRPTSHKVFGEALAILAGDCLLTMAFETIAGSGLDGDRRAEQLRVLAVGAGGCGMVGGQVLDLEAERGPLVSEEHRIPAKNAGLRTANSADYQGSRPSDSAKSPPIGSNSENAIRVDHLSRIHTMKTGALICASLELGAVSAGADVPARRLLRQYGHDIGLAFQIADDLLDVTGNNQQLGKETGRDASLGKLTYPAVLGIDESRRYAEQLVQNACRLLEVYGEKGGWLRDLASFIVERDH